MNKLWYTTPAFNGAVRIVCHAIFENCKSFGAQLVVNTDWLNIEPVGERVAVVKSYIESLNNAIDGYVGPTGTTHDWELVALYPITIDSHHSGSQMRCKRCGKECMQ